MRLEEPRVFDALRDQVALVRLVTLDERLRGHDALAGFADGDVDVRRTKLALQRVRDGLDRTEVVAALGVREEPPIALEIRPSFERSSLLVAATRPSA